MALNVLMENSFKDEFNETFGEDRDDRRPAHVDQPQTLSGALCSEVTLNIARCAVLIKQMKTF